MMLDCHGMDFSQLHSQRRLAVANQALGADVVKRQISFSLYLMGASRTGISGKLKIPRDTIKSLTKRVYRDGLPALADRRFKPASGMVLEQKTITVPKITIKDNHLQIDLGLGQTPILILTKNVVQSKVVLLTLYEAGYLKSSTLSRHFGYTVNHISHLSKLLKEDDVSALLDKRTGQQQDYRFTPEVKSEVFAQYILDIASGGRSSGEQLTKNLKERCQLELSPRTVRSHIKKSGLSILKKKLPALLASLKKTQKSNR